jgi:hypothetical protein
LKKKIVKSEKLLSPALEAISIVLLAIAPQSQIVNATFIQLSSIPVIISIPPLATCRVSSSNLKAGTRRNSEISLAWNALEN